MNRYVSLCDCKSKTSGDTLRELATNGGDQPAYFIHLWERRESSQQGFELHANFRMPHLTGHFDRRFQDEPPEWQESMWHDQVWLVNNQVVIEQQIQINRTWSPVLFSDASQLMLDTLHLSEQVARRKWCFKSHCGI